VKESASSPIPENIDQHGAIRFPFLIVPLYALAVAFYAVDLASAVEMPAAAQNLVKDIACVPGAGRFMGMAVLLFLLGLAGIAARSLECARIMPTPVHPRPLRPRRHLRLDGREVRWVKSSCLSNLLKVKLLDSQS